MAVGDFGFVEQGVEGSGHDDWMLRAGELKGIPWG
jgi:hypothetical protein